MTKVIEKKQVRLGCGTVDRWYRSLDRLLEWWSGLAGQVARMDRIEPTRSGDLREGGERM
jgi:hypothetical protein